jgi:Flp pilus assembly protein TadG
MKLMQRSARKEKRGQALVEFALVFPLLVLLIFGLIDLGRAVYAQHTLSEAAREGARWGSVQARSATDLPGIEDHAESKAIGIGDVTATATCIRPGSIVLPCSASDVLEVTVETDFEMVTPVIAQLMGALGLNPLELSSTSNVLVNN